MVPVFLDPEDGFRGICLGRQGSAPRAKVTFFLILFLPLFYLLDHISNPSLLSLMERGVIDLAQILSVD